MVLEQIKKKEKEDQEAKKKKKKKKKRKPTLQEKTKESAHDAKAREKINDFVNSRIKIKQAEKLKHKQDLELLESLEQDGFDPSSLFKKVKTSL